MTDSAPVSSTEAGDRLEIAIYALLKTEIAADRFFLKRSACKLFKKKAYHSRDRNSKIIFDIAIEAYLPGAREFSFLVLVECKNFTKRPVQVDDVEEFFAKTQQVGASNSKAILATNAAFQSGAMEFAKAKGIGLIRYFGPENFKWELRRSPSASTRGTAPYAEQLVIDGLVRPEFQSTEFDLFIQTPERPTNALWDLFDDLLVSSGLSSTQIRAIANSQRRQVSVVRFREKPELDALVEETLGAISYSSGPVSLDAICKLERARAGLKVRTSVPAPPRRGAAPSLGRIQFDPLCIDIFSNPKPHVGRDRFTLAHELAHHLLRHGDYMRRESCDEQDFDLDHRGLRDGSDIARLEYQANYFAASLLLPRSAVVPDFWKLIRTLDLQDRGRGALYVDNQPCNIESFMTVTGTLKNRYQVSRAAVRNRLVALGLLNDARNAPAADTSFGYRIRESSDSWEA